MGRKHVVDVILAFMLLNLCHDEVEHIHGHLLMIPGIVHSVLSQGLGYVIWHLRGSVCDPCQMQGNFAYQLLFVAREDCLLTI